MSSSGCAKTASGVADLVLEHRIEPGLAAAARPGERVNGDVAVVESAAAGAFIAVVDGAGHGPEARGAACAANLRVFRVPAGWPPATQMPTGSRVCWRSGWRC